jgi:hypothetical protein
MRTLYFLNESRRPEDLGHIDVFSSINLLIRSVEAIDVVNREYSAFSSDGIWIKLRAESEYAPVTYEIEQAEGSQQLFAKLISEYLTNVVSKTNHAVAPDKLAKASSLRELANLIPWSMVISS